MNDPGELIADALVTFVKSQNYNLPVDCGNYDDPETELESDHLQSVVMFFPMEDELITATRSGEQRHTVTIRMLVARSLRDSTVTRKDMTRLCWEIIQSVFDQDMNGYALDSISTIEKFSTELLQTQKRFVSQVNLVYFNAAQ